MTCCVRCWAEGLEVEATVLVGSNTLCGRHSHPSQEPHRPRFTVIEGGRE